MVHDSPQLTLKNCKCMADLELPPSIELAQGVDRLLSVYHRRYSISLLQSFKSNKNTETRNNNLAI